MAGTSRAGGPCDAFLLISAAWDVTFVRLSEVESSYGPRCQANDPYHLVQGNAAFWTNLRFADIHPNAKGYQAPAYSLTRAQ